jgi:hypothetical protein
VKNNTPPFFQHLSFPVGLPPFLPLARAASFFASELFSPPFFPSSLAAIARSA